MIVTFLSFSCAFADLLELRIPSSPNHFTDSQDKSVRADAVSCFVVVAVFSFAKLLVGCDGH